MNERGAFIVDPGRARVWESEPGLPTARYSGAEAPEMGALFEDMRSTLEPVKRRTPRQRYESFMQTIVADALASYKATGRGRWPRSVDVVLAEVAKETNDPSLVKDATSVEEIITQGKALARYVTEQGEMRQKAQDYKKVVRDWSGH